MIGINTLDCVSVGVRRFGFSISEKISRFRFLMKVLMY